MTRPSRRVFGRGLADWVRPRSFRQQIVILTAGVTAVAMVLLSVLLQVVLGRVATSDIDRVLADRTSSIVSAVGTGPGGVLKVPDEVLDPGVAVFDANGDLVAGDTPRSLHEFYEDLAASSSVQVKKVRGDNRVRSQPFTTRAGTPGVVVVTEDLGPYEESERLALIVTLVTGLLATAAAAGVAAWATRRALRPVAEMALTTSDWSEHDLGRRFDLSQPTNELSALAGTLDHLLDKVAAAIRSEQRLTSELAHELRTPLTAIQGTADLMALRDGPHLPAQSREDLAEIAAASRRMAGTIATLLDLARTSATVTAAAHSNLAEVVAEAVGDLDTALVRLDVDVADVRVAMPRSLAVRTLAPVVENAVRYASTEVTLRTTHEPGRVWLVISNDGPQVDPSITAHLFEPGWTSGGGTGLGLAIARRIARAADGDVRLRESATGASFEIELPLV